MDASTTGKLSELLIVEGPGPKAHALTPRVDQLPVLVNKYPIVFQSLGDLFKIILVSELKLPYPAASK